MPDWLPKLDYPIDQRLTWALATAAFLLVLLVALALAARRRRSGDARTTTADQPRRTDGRALETLLTVAAAGIATAVAVSGMWQVFGDALGYDGVSRITMCAFLEIALMVSAIRARRSLRETGSVGVDGAAVWVVALLSAVLASSDAATLLGGAVRFCAPLVAAWLWERGMAPDRRLRRAAQEGEQERLQRRGPIAWRWTRERVAVALRLADPVARSTTEVDRARRLATLTQARLRLAVLEADHPWWVRLLLAHPIRAQLAAAVLQRHALGAVEHLSLGRDPSVTQQIRTTVAAVVGLAQATSPDSVRSSSPWRNAGGEVTGEQAPEAYAPAAMQGLEEELARVEQERQRELEERLARVEQQRREELEERLAQVEQQRRQQLEERLAQEQQRRRALDEQKPPVPPSQRSTRSTARRPVPAVPAGTSEEDWAEVWSWYRGQRAAGCDGPPPPVPEQVWAWYLAQVQSGRPLAAESAWCQTWEAPRATAGRWRRACVEAGVEPVELPRLELVPAAASA
ncbi:MAG: hypothetical protein QOE58_3441 [Actinomycetota bacterium]|jgi:hypothetical protein|nr:hypothetical protein [Actinomycetota bacterium]